MPKVTPVESVQDAVELAQTFKAEGRYDWFRGQIRDWTPASSLHRLHRDVDDAAIELTRARMQLFWKWVGENPILSYLLDGEHNHDFYAIAQHYGIPTQYLDFTTEPAVAGFFAADSRVPPTDGMSCIYCLNTKDLLETVEILKTTGKRNEASINIIDVKVDNLWRLQAQHGVFLSSNYNWDIDYPMDRIIFPYTGYPSYPRKDFIYPSDKSALESLIDQYLISNRSISAIFESGQWLRR